MERSSVHSEQTRTAIIEQIVKMLREADDRKLNIVLVFVRSLTRK